GPRSLSATSRPRCTAARRAAAEPEQRSAAPPRVDTSLGGADRIAFPPHVQGTSGSEMAVEAASTDGSVETEQDAQPRLYLHVGRRKAGATFLQAALRTHADALAQHGFCYPSLHDGAMFHAAVEMTGSQQRWGLAPEKIDGTFSALVEHGRESGRSVIIS